MNDRYRVFRRRWGVYYCEDRESGKQESLKTRDKQQAFRLVAAKNEADASPGFSMHLARVYWQAGDPQAATRTWQQVMDEIPKLKQGSTKVRWLSAIKNEAFDPLRKLVVLETRPEHFLGILEGCKVSTNSYLRRLHCFAMDMNWLPWPVLPRKRWPVIRFKDKRAITWQEHQNILLWENNPEWRAYYELLWHLGGSQTDVARLSGSLQMVFLPEPSGTRRSEGAQVSMILGPPPRISCAPTTVAWGSRRCRCSRRRWRLRGCRTGR